MATLLDHAAAFLAGPGHRVAARALAGQGLPAHLADDVVQEALIRVLRAQRRGEAVANVAAFTTVLVRRVVQDLGRGVRRRPEGEVLADPIEDLGASVLVDDEPAALPELVALRAEASEEARRRVAAALVRTPRPAAGALAVLAIVLHGAGPAADCPTPKAGAGDDEALAWAGLFYAGRRECFPADGAPDDAATRKRRSRAVAEQRAVLREALGGSG